jgi:hypothetical protein
MWAFTQPPNYGVSTNPTQGAHFVNDRVDRNDALVRESGQNTNDARASGVPTVELRFTLLSGENAPSRQALRPYIDDLIPHLQAAAVDLEPVDFSRPSLLLVEDFGTVGLLGATDEDDGESFSCFWRNVGESHKEGSRGGRWGLGKTVFLNSSRISTWFALTIRKNDPRPLVIGQIALRKHRIDETTYQPHALYCSSAPGQFELPIEDAERVSAFRTTFGITRAEQPGLSVAVPFPHETVTETNLLKAAIQHFFFPILRGRMVIKVNNRELNRSTLRTIAAEVDGPELREMGVAIGVAEDICNIAPEALNSIDHRGALDFPNGQLDASAFTPEKLATLKQAYQRGELLALQIPITIKPKCEDPRESHIKLYLKHQPALSKGQDFYLRDGISVIEHRCFGEAEKAIGVLLADDEVVSRFLGDSENPAHTAWSAKAGGLESKYREPQKSVMFIRRALRQFFDVVAKEEGVTDPNALIDVFFVPREDGVTSQRGGPTGGGPPPRQKPPPSPNPKISVSQIHGGFLVKAGSGLTAADLPLLVNVKAAYEIRRGNPFGSYHRSDFEFEREPIAVSADAAKVSAIAGTGNLLSFQVDADDFEVQVTGFDPHRDLKLSTAVSSEEPAHDSTL